jgi:hypothetical protein
MFVRQEPKHFTQIADNCSLVFIIFINIFLDNISSLKLKVQMICYAQQRLTVLVSETVNLIDPNLYMNNQVTDASSGGPLVLTT